MCRSRYLSQSAIEALVFKSGVEIGIAHCCSEFHLMQQHMVTIRSQGLDPIEAWGLADAESTIPDDSRVSRYVGHIYQIKFDAWTFAKANL